MEIIPVGLGDEVMAAGQAERLWREAGRAVAILDRHGRPRRHALWEGNPAIDPAGPLKVVSGSGCRPYLRYPWSRRAGQRFTDWRARDHRASLHFTAAERIFAAAVPGPFIVIEPAIKAKANPNKDWGFDRWQAVVDLAPDLPWLQLFDPGAPPAEVPPRLRGVAALATPTFRQACAILARAAAYAGAEGGLHHAAAAVRVPAVVLWNPSVPVEALGYPEHVNLGVPAEACGRWLPCDHCRAALAAVTPELVVEAILTVAASAAPAAPARTPTRPPMARAGAAGG